MRVRLHAHRAAKDPKRGAVRVQRLDVLGVGNLTTLHDAPCAQPFYACLGELDGLDADSTPHTARRPLEARVLDDAGSKPRAIESQPRSGRVGGRKLRRKGALR